MKLTILGSGSPEACQRRASSGYLIECGEDKILFDCGGGVFDRLIQSGRKPSDINYLFFSHLHSDHMMDYARLVHAAWDEGASPLNVYGPAPISSMTEKLFGRDGVFATDLRARTENKGSQEVWLSRGGTLPRPWPTPEVREISPGFTVTINNWSLSSCSVPHAQPQLTCMAFRIETSDYSIVYSGDAALCDDLSALSKDTDLLIHWCYRLPGETANPYIASKSPAPLDIGAMAEKAGVKRLLLTHFRPHMDESENHRIVLEDVSKEFNGEAQIAEDLLQIDLAKNSDIGT